MANTSEVTTDRETIRKWAEEHGGVPARIKTTGDADAHKDAGLIRIEFDKKNDKFEEISWDDFFEKMEESGLAMIIQHQHADGSDSTFNRFVKLEDHPEAKANHGKSGHKAGDHAKDDHSKAHSSHGGHAPHPGQKG